MDIDKTDFVNLLAEFGSDISTPSSSFKGIYVPLQATKQLLDVKLNPGDAVVYTDPAESLTLGELLTFKGKSFLLVSNSKIQYINGNPIYMELGLEWFLPSLNLQSSYDIRTCISLSLSSLYNINQNLFSKSIPSSYDIFAPTLVSASTLLSSLYNINQNLFSKSIPSSYDIYAPTLVSASTLLSSLYNINQNLFSVLVPSSYDIPTPASASLRIPSLYNINQNLFSVFVPSSYDISAALAQVTGLRAEADEGRNIWTFWILIEDEDLDYYKVHRSTVSDFAPSDANLVGVPKTNQFVHKDLDSVTKYYVKVCAVNKQGDSGSYSTQAYATTVE